MTKKEREAVKAWNIAQGKAKEEALKAYNELRTKYKDLMRGRYKAVTA